MHGTQRLPYTFRICSSPRSQRGSLCSSAHAASICVSRFAHRQGACVPCQVHASGSDRLLMCRCEWPQVQDAVLAWQPAARLAGCLHYGKAVTLLQGAHHAVPRICWQHTASCGAQLLRTVTSTIPSPIGACKLQQPGLRFVLRLHMHVRTQWNAFPVHGHTDPASCS